MAILKLASVGTRMLDGLIPDVPRVYLVRDALPVVMRVLRDPPVWLQQTLPPGWVTARRSASQPLDAFASDSGLDDDVRAALVEVATSRWNDVISAAFEWSTSSGALIVDHGELVADPVATVRRVLTHFRAHEADWGVGPGGPDDGADELDDSVASEVLGRHAKSGAVLAAPGQPVDPSPLGAVWETRVMAQTLQWQQQLDQWRAGRNEDEHK